MKNYYSISIPKPCHEDWNAMSPKEKGRFCDSCSKTVIDFTKMDTFQIQDFIDENIQNHICGHFKQSQLDSINLVIPSQILIQKQNFHKMFLLALLIVMGMSLMNCTNRNGDKQKIDSIELLDNQDTEKIDVTLGLFFSDEEDTISNKTCNSNSKKSTIINVLTTEGELVVEPVGKIEIDSLNIKNEPTKDEEIQIMGDIMPDDEILIGFISVETPPEFPNTPQNLSSKEKKDYFSKHITEIISKNFNTSVCLELKGKQKIFTQFKIDKKGNVIDVRVRAPHIKLDKEAKRVIELLPQFIPAKQRDKPIPVVYTLPIIFEVEE